MREWLATRRQIPNATREGLRAAANERLAGVANAPTSSPTGAPAALRRLEGTEERLFRLLETALQSGDPVGVKLARENWLAVSDSLRRFDLLVERARRDTGELISRAECERHVNAFVRHTKIAIMRAIGALAPQLAGESDPGEIANTLAPALVDQILNALAVLSAAPSTLRLPGWFVDAALAPIDETLSDADRALRARADVVKEALTLLVNAGARHRAGGD